MPQPKKDQRPRLDALIRHIKAGSYDDDMGQLQGAIQDRQRVRQEAVIGLVKEVFGSDFTVSQPRQNFVSRPRPGGPLLTDPETGELTESPHVQIPDDEDVLGPDDESRSPIIGSIEDSDISAEDSEHS